MPPEPAVTETVTCVLPAAPVGVAGVPGTTTGATVVVVAADPELPELPVETGAIEAAAEHPPARA